MKQESMSRHYPAIDVEYSQGASTIKIVDYEYTMMELISELRERTQEMNSGALKSFMTIHTDKVISDAQREMTDPNLPHHLRVRLYKCVMFFINAVRRVDMLENNR